MPEIFFQPVEGVEAVTQDDLERLMDECALVLSHDDVAQGAELLGEIAAKLASESSSEEFNPTAKAILEECGRSLEEFRDEHIEYILLALHTLHVCYRQDENET